MRKYAELYIKRRNEVVLDFVDDDDYDSYEIATNEIIEKYLDKLNKLKDIVLQLEKEITNIQEEVGNYEDEATFKLIDKQLFYEEKINENRAYLNSVVEMKIIHLFRSIELNMKHLIKNAYPTGDLKTFFRWESMKSFFVNKGIELPKIDGYVECLELRKLNNCIKHSSIISADIQKISEFKEEPSLEYEQLQQFYNRIKLKVRLFVCELKNEIKNDLYIFTDSRLDKLVKEFYERMDQETYLKFILKMESKRK